MESGGVAGADMEWLDSGIGDGKGEGELCLACLDFLALAMPDLFFKSFEGLCYDSHDTQTLFLSFTHLLHSDSYLSRS